MLRIIKDMNYLQELIKEGYVLRGPRQEQSKDLGVIEKFFSRGYEFVPEEWLINHGYQLVEPSGFTKGLKLAYKLVDERPEKYVRSNYSLLKGNKEMPLYLKQKE